MKGKRSQLKLSNNNDRTGVELQTQYKIAESNTVVAAISFANSLREGNRYYDIVYVLFVHVYVLFVCT